MNDAYVHCNFPQTISKSGICLSTETNATYECFFVYLNRVELFRDVVLRCVLFQNMDPGTCNEICARLDSEYKTEGVQITFQVGDSLIHRVV